MSGQKPREIALRILRAQGRDFVENLLENDLARVMLSAPDRHLCQELAYGVVRWRATLDWLIARKTEGRIQKTLLQNLLRLGLYQIFWLERIPPHAAVHETVELTKQSGMGDRAGFVNAVLRGYLREFEPTRRLLEDLKTTQPAVGYSHPDWLVARWQQRWGADLTSKLLAWNNTPPKTYARVNTLKIDAGKLLERWRDENVEYDLFSRDWLEENLVFELKSHPPLARLPSFQQGLFYVQDPSTLLAVCELDAQPGENILDLCAAPGGKLTYLAQRMASHGRIVAHDLTPERLKLIEENCNRLGITCIEPVLPAQIQGSSKGGPPGLFDRILLDAPCSNTGVIRRRVELRWRITPTEIHRLQKLQLSLLQQAASLLRPGGKLAYSTCSLEPEENGELVQQFLQAHPAFEIVHIRELLPFEQNVDGAYVGILKHRG